ncbi:MAG TPA: acyl carrier protein [Rhizomicrobium sp.]|jgi:acyl carrier protein|nr:acyl carrier protein [Rhizomicrobium sp.]
MTDQEILSRLDNIVADVLDLGSLHLTTQTVASEVEGWDSLNHVRIVVAVEEAFRVRFSTAEIQGLKSVGDLVSLIARKAT